MAQTKSHKRYKTNKKVQSAKIKAQKFGQTKKREEAIKTEKLMKEDFVDEEQEQEQHEQKYLELANKIPKKSAAPKQSLTTAEVEKFLKGLSQSNDADDNDDDVQDLLKEVDDDKEMIETNDDGAKTNVDGGADEDDVADDVSDIEEGETAKRSRKIADEEEDDVSDDEGTMTRDDDIFANKTEVTKELVASWITACKKSKSLRAAKQLLLTFFAAVHQDDDPEELKKNIKRKQVLNGIPYYVGNHEMLLRVVVACVKYCLVVFDHHTKHDHTSDKLPNKNSAGYKKITVLVLTLARASIHLLETVKNQELLSYFLKCLLDIVPYFGHLFDGESRKLLKALLNLLGDGKETVRFRAFLAIRKMAVMYPYPFLDLCLKGVYFTLVKNSNAYDAKSFKVIEFLKNSVVELYGIDLPSSYQHAFIYIRELAITLRRALEPKKTAFALCYNWTFLNSLDCWIKVISAYSTELSELIYPVAQLLLGSLEVNKDARFAVLRIHVIRLINQFTTFTGKYIPVIPYLLQMLESRSIRGSSNVVAPRGVDFDFSLRASKNDVKTKEFKDRLQDEVLYLILETLALQARSVAFPEFAFPVIKYLKKLIKKDGTEFSPIFRKRITNLSKKIQEHAHFVTEKRSTLGVSPIEFIQEHKAFIEKDDKNAFINYYEYERKVHDQHVQDRITSKMNEQAAKPEQDDDYQDAKPKNNKRKRQEIEDDFSDDDGAQDASEPAAKKRKTEQGAVKQQQQPKQQPLNAKQPKQRAPIVQKQNIPKKDKVSTLDL